MLNHQPWVHTAPDMITEWEQCYDEGHDVAAFREMCETVSRSGYAWDDTAKKITDQMKNAPIRALIYRLSHGQTDAEAVASL